MEIMSKNELSSVEWLEQELKKIPFVNVLEVFEQAKAMHKDEIKNAFTNGYISHLGSNRILDENFYNETFQK